MKADSAILKLESVSKSFGGLRAVDQVSLLVAESTICSLIGPNGAGKTTLFNIINGFIKPDEGTILFQERQLNHLQPFAISRLGIARTFQDVRLLQSASTLENVMLAFRNQPGESFWKCIVGVGRYEEQRNHKVAMDILDFVGLAGKAGESAGNLSYGQQKLLSLACALAMEAKLLLLDEPVAGVDPAMTEQLLTLIQRLREEGKTILLIEHDLEAVMQISDRVIVMETGKIIAEGSPDLIREDPKVLEVYIR